MKEKIYGKSKIKVYHHHNSMERCGSLNSDIYNIMETEIDEDRNEIPPNIPEGVLLSDWQKMNNGKMTTNMNGSFE